MLTFLQKRLLESIHCNFVQKIKYWCSQSHPDHLKKDLPSQAILVLKIQNSARLVRPFLQIIRMRLWTPLYYLIFELSYKEWTLVMYMLVRGPVFSFCILLVILEKF